MSDQNAKQICCEIVITMKWFDFWPNFCTSHKNTPV